MRYNPRHESIMSYIKVRGSATVAELSAHTHKSETTVRRILRSLETSQLVERFHGGAVLSEGNAQSDGLGRRQNLNKPEKDLIANLAASRVTDGQTIVLLAGTTVAAMAPLLLGRRQLKVITNSVPVLQALLPHGDIKVIFVGGVLDHEQSCTTGYLVTLCMKQLHADTLFLGAWGVHPSHGIMADGISDVDAVRSFIAAADRVVVLADHTKFNRSGTIAVCASSEIHTVITDDEAPATALDQLRELGVEIVTARQEGTRSRWPE